MVDCKTNLLKRTSYFLPPVPGRLRSSLHLGGELALGILLLMPVMRAGDGVIRGGDIVKMRAGS
jgi:hypothetical protein